MADFKTHIATSSVLGVAYGAGAAIGFGVPLDQCMLATGLCSVSGMLPDIDSNHGVPLRESLAFGAAVVPMLLIDRFRHWGFTTDMMVLCGALIYVFIRFGFGWFLRHYTVHRGMFHSIPAAVIFAELTYLICDCEDMSMRLFKAVAVFIGFMSHLVLDEFYSLYWYRGRLRKKKSFGTALKLWGPKLWGNFSTFGKLALLTYVVFYEGDWMEHWHHHGEPRIADTRSADRPPNLASEAPSQHGEAAGSNLGQRTWLRPPGIETRGAAYDGSVPWGDAPPAPNPSAATQSYPNAPAPTSGGQENPATWTATGYDPGHQYHGYPAANFTGQGEQGAYQNGNYPSGPYQDSQYQNGGYQNGAYQNSDYQHGGYQNNAQPYGTQPQGTYPQGAYPQGAYPTDHRQSGGYDHGRY